MSAIPSYTYPCLLSASTTDSSIYLIGVSNTTRGLLEINTIDLSNINTPRITHTLTQANNYQWSNTAPKVCSQYPAYSPPPNALANAGVFHIQQFGMGWSNDANVYPAANTLENPGNFDTIAFTNPKLFATVGNAGSSQFVMTMTNLTEGWAGLRFNATTTFESLYDFELGVKPSLRPFLAVGSYTPVAKVPSRGNAIVFDTARSGTIYTAVGYDTPETNLKAPTLVLSAPQPVVMADIVLTTDAIPISSSGSSYILDKAADSSLVIYTINPSQSTTLQSIAFSGQAPKFASTMYATVTPFQIVIYSIQPNGPRFDVFDLTTKTWSASTVPSIAPPTGNGSNTPSTNTGNNVSLGGIIGGVVGGLVLIALAVFLIVRYRRRSSSLSSSSSSQHSKNENGKTELGSASSVDQDREDINHPDSYIPPPVSYPIPPKSAFPRDPQMTPDMHFSPPFPDSKDSMRRNPQSSMGSSQMFDYIPKAPPGPELHYSEDYDSSNHNKGYHDGSAHGSNCNSNNTIVVIDRSLESFSKDISSPITIVEPYIPYGDKSPTCPSTGTPIGSPELHNRK
ncbi:hypothetical protein FBU30_002896 [Linnemannia zychae]|nr:hypothetical protein FBU30_002896 [Linnemannia zychae]